MPLGRRHLLRLGLPAVLGGLVALSPSIAHADNWSASDPENSSAEEAVTDAPDPLDLIYDLLGLPYIWGSVAGRSYFGLNPRGFDCSAFASYVMRLAFGLYLPAYTAAAWQASWPVRDVHASDLAFWGMANRSPRLQHMAIVLDDGNTVVQAGGARNNNVNIASAWSNGIPTFRRAL